MAKFVDQVKIFIKAGDGGDGCASFRREKFVPKGGPSGGDGGCGGNVIFKGDRGFLTLLDFRYQPILKASRGGHGLGKDCHGRSGNDHISKVPLGTIVKCLDTNIVLGEVLEHGQELIVAKGGRGGRGNKRFVSSTNRAPRRVEEGKPGEEKNLFLELKLIADIGFVGAPNAGKSTLINYIAQTRSKVAPYPFTTLTPVLGVVDLDYNNRIVVADMPGLIKDASKGRGLGDQFLRHIERSRALVFLLDMSDKPCEDYEMLSRELSSYNKELSKKKYIIAANKIDLKASKENIKKLRKEFRIPVKNIFPISALMGDGIEKLLDGMRRLRES